MGFEPKQADFKAGALRKTHLVNLQGDLGIVSFGGSEIGHLWDGNETPIFGDGPLTISPYSAHEMLGRNSTV